MKETAYKDYEDLPMVLSALDVANALRISRAGAYDLLRSESFPTLKIGRRVVVSKEAFIQWIKENSGESNA